MGYFDGNKEFRTIKKYSADKYEIYIQDMIYIGKSKSDGCVTLKRSDDRCDEISKGVVEYLPLWKSYPWQYENECRLVLRIKDDNMSDKATDAQIIISQVLEGETIKKVLSPNYKGYKKEGYEYSNLRCELNWDLCRNCNNLRADDKG